MSKKYIRVRAGKRRAFPMRIFIDKTTKGFEVSQFDGKYKTTLKADIQTHYNAMIVAKEWEEYYWRLGRGAKIIDFSKD